MSNGEFAGHEMCGNGGSYFNGLTDNGTGSLWTLTRWQGSFHPNYLGQNAYAYSFEDYILQAHFQHVPLTAAGLPVDPKFGGTQVTPNALQPAARAAEPALRDAADGATLAFGDLAVASQQSQSCPESYEQGQTITLTGAGFAPGASVTVALEPGWTQSVTQVVTADPDGQISATIQIPSDLAGPQQSAGDAPMGYVEADGAGGSSTNQMDNIAFNILPAGTTCANPEPASASATITLTGDSPAVPAVGAVFAITGPGLPQPDAAYTPGTFAELDIATDGSTICPAAEPSGASCVSGIIGGLDPGGTYTATEVSAPPGYTSADAQTFAAASDGSTTSVAFDNVYTGPPVAGGVTVNLAGADGAPLVGGATFAITGPGLPPVSYGVPGPGTFAEVDVDSDDVPGCAPTEPAGVTCGDGLLSGLETGATYTVSEVEPPPGYAAAAPVTVTASGDGRPVLASFVNVAAASLPTAGVSVRLASDGTSSRSLAGAVFAVSGPGLPALGTAADAGSFAELDTDPAGDAVCPQAEPSGVSCANAAITGLAAGSLYTITEVHAPSGYAPAASEQFITSTTGAITTVAITNTAQVKPAVSWASPRPISYGTPLSSAQLDATAPVPGTFSYDPTPGTVLGAGSHTLSVTFTPDDAAHYTTADATVTLDVEPATPTITWANPDAITYGTPLSPTQLDATASVPGTFAYNPAAGAMLGAGSHTLSVTFTPDDETNYTTATAAVTLVVDKANPTVNWPSPAPLLYGEPLASTQFDATASVPGDFTYSPVPGVVLDPGTHQLTLTFTPVDGADYNDVVLTSEVNVGFSQPCITANRAGPLTIRSGQAICVGQGGRIAGPINVEAGGALWVDGGALTGPLSAKPGSTISINSGTLTGPLNANGAQLVEVCGSRLTGPVTVNATTGAVELGGQGCVGDTITGPVDVVSNTGGVSVVDNTVTGPLTIIDNTGGFQYSGNSVTGPVNVSNNT